MAVSYKFIDEKVGLSSLPTQIDASALQEVGYIALGKDATYGVGEFMYVKYTGTVAAGDFVAVDRGAVTCVQASTSTKTNQLGIAMAAGASGQYGWIMLRGIHDGANVASGVTAGTGLYVSATAGRAAGSGATNKIDGAYERLVTASGGNVGTAEINWPSAGGNG